MRSDAGGGTQPAQGRLATVDLGTNTILLLVADVIEARELRPVHEEERFVRLGEGVDATGRLSEAAIERVLAALAEYQRTARELDAEIVVVGATSASRDAENTADLAARVRRELGLPYEVLSGADEALWSLRGALSCFPTIGQAIVVDAGGGSTEIVCGEGDAREVSRHSIDVGAVRITERFFRDVPPEPAEVEVARRFIDSQLARVDLPGGLPLVGAAGTVNALARLALGPAGGGVVPLSAVVRWQEELLRLRPEEVRRLCPEVLSGREDVFAAGVMIIAAVMRHLGADSLLPSPRGLLHGLALRAATAV